MKVLETDLPDVLIVESPVFADERGYFIEVFHSEKFARLGLPSEFAQDNRSRSVRHTLRGLHFQSRHPQGKLVQATFGTIFDVAVDVRRSSRTFGKSFGVTLSAGDGRSLWIPPGFAHGFLVLSESADVSYKCTTLYDHAADRCIAWNDTELAVAWPLPVGVTPIVSSKDAAAPPFAEAEHFA